MRQVVDYIVDNRWLIIRYSISGLAGACVQILVLFILVHFLETWYLLAAGIALCVAIIFTFTMHKLWTFKERTIENLHRQSIEYVLVVVASLCINSILMYFFVTVLNIWYILSQVLALGMTAVGSFFLNRFVTFR